MTEYRNNDPKIASPLARMRGIIRRYVLIESVLAVGLFLAAWFWLALLLDYGIFRLFTFDWVLDAPWTLRAIGLTAAAILLLGIVFTKVLLRISRDFTQSSLALILEKRFPDILGDRLITAVQLADVEKGKSYGYSGEMIERTIATAREKMDSVPVSSVFNWRRLRVQAFQLVALSFGFLLLIAGAVCAITKISPATFTREFTDVSTILTERNLLLKNTPWPRRAYLELIDFPGDEIRIVRGQDVNIKAVAYKWVIADNSSPVGWRPIKWGEISKVLAAEKPADIPASVLQSLESKVLDSFPKDVAEWKVDHVEQLFLVNETSKAKAIEKFNLATEIEQIQQTLNKLAAKAADPAMSRTFRQLRIPTDVVIEGWGLTTSVRKSLGAEPFNTFSVVLSSGTKGKDKDSAKEIIETIRFTVSGDDFNIPTKQITLVPPPKLQELYRDEYQPAYLYYRGPYVDEKELEKEQKPYRSNPSLLKGLKQVVANQPISLSGDSSRFEIPAGTEFILRGRSDKPLVEAKIAQAAKMINGEADKQFFAPQTLTINDGHQFEYAFTAKNNSFIPRDCEFDITLKDTDGVTSKRTVLVQVKEDRPPEVNVEVDIIRKVDGVYLCTPQALIPFKPGSGATPGSTITDDNGLNRVDYVFSYYEIEPAAITQKRAEFAAWYWSKAPIFPTIGDVLHRVAVHGMTYDKIKSDKAVVDSFSPLKAFIGDYTNRPETLDQIKSLITKAKPTPAEIRVINRIDYRASENEPKFADEDREEPKYSFDLKRSVPGLKRESENEVQRNYLLTLNIIAVDSNVESAKPGVSQNKETLTFRLVSDAELLTRIAMDEAKLADDLEEVIKKLNELDTKFRSFAARVPSLQNPELFISEQSAVNDMFELLTAAKGKTSEVNAKYNAILLEYKTNRMEKNLIEATKTKIVDKLGDVLEREFKQTEEAYSTVQGLITQSRQPEATQVFTTQQKITILLEKLREIRGGIGQGLDFKKAITDAEAILKLLRQGKTYLDDWAKLETNLIEAINPRVPNAPVAISAGQKLTVRIPVVIGPAYSEKYEIKFEPSAGSELKVPEKLTLKEGDREFSLDVTAGNIKGTFAVRIIPDVGPVKDLRVIVK